MTMNILEQSGNVLLWKTTTPLKCEKLAVRTEQLLCIAMATGSKIHTRESEAETDSRVRHLVLSLKQYHAHYYWFYEKGIMRAMVGLWGLHTSDAFRCSNMSSSIGLKSFCP